MSLANWETTDSPLWGCKAKIEKAIDRFNPDRFQEDLSDEEGHCSLGARALGLVLTNAQKPTPDEILPMIDESLLSVRSAHNQTDRLKALAGSLEKAREMFVEHTRNPEEWALPEEEEAE